MDNTELLPCPFCGSDAIVKKKATTMVSCTKCTASTFQQYADQLSAIASWNTRAPIKAATEQEPDSVIKESLNTEPVAIGELRKVAGAIYLHNYKPLTYLHEHIGKPLYANPPANKDSERLAFVLGHGTPGSWNYPSGKKYGYARGNRVFESAIEAIDAAMAKGEK